MTDENIRARFDYTILDESKRIHIQIQTEAIKMRMKRTAEDVIAIGLDLMDVKRELEHGSFQKWLKAEFDMSESTATKFMQVAARFGDEIKSVKITDFPATVLYTLAAPSTPNEIVERVLSGEIPADARAIKDAKEAQKQAEDALSQEQKERSSIEKRVLDIHYDQQALLEELKIIKAERDHLKQELEGGLQAYYDQKLQMKAENTFLGLISHGMQKLAEVQQYIDHVVSPSMLQEVLRFGDGHQERFLVFLAQIQSTYHALYEAEMKLTGPVQDTGIVDEHNGPT